MSKKQTKQKPGRKQLPDNQRRVRFVAFVAPATLKRIELDTVCFNHGNPGRLRDSKWPDQQPGEPDF